MRSKAVAVTLLATYVILTALTVSARTVEPSWSLKEERIMEVLRKNYDNNPQLMLYSLRANQMTKDLNALRDHFDRRLNDLTTQIDELRKEVRAQHP